MVSFSRLITRATVMCVHPSQSKLLAVNLKTSIVFGFVPSGPLIAALENLLQRPGVLATPRDLESWAEIKVLHGSKTLRAALEGFAYADTPPSHNISLPFHRRPLRVAPHRVPSRNVLSLSTRILRRSQLPFLRSPHDGGDPCRKGC